MFALEQALEAYDFFQQQLAACDKRSSDTSVRWASALSSRVRAPPRPEATQEPAHFDCAEELARIAGVDVCQIEGIDGPHRPDLISECGTDMTPFPTEKNFASWLGLCPNNRKTGGRIRSRRTRRVKNSAARAFRVAAQALHRSNSALGSYARQMKARLGAGKAITATAHKLASLYYRLMKNGEPYFAQTQAQYDALRRERDLRALRRRASSLRPPTPQHRNGRTHRPDDGNEPPIRGKFLSRSFVSPGDEESAAPPALRLRIPRDPSPPSPSE